MLILLEVHSTPMMLLSGSKGLIQQQQQFLFHVNLQKKLNGERLMLCSASYTQDTEFGYNMLTEQHYLAAWAIQFHRNMEWNNRGEHAIGGHFPTERATPQMRQGVLV